ncbi:MAG: DUF4410 domain-containing protein [Nitrospirota bacterium]
MKKLFLIFALIALLVPAGSIARMKAPDVLDHEDIKTDESLSKYKSIGIKMFSADDVELKNVDDEEKRQLKNYLPDWREKLAKTIKNELNGDNFKAFVINDEGKNAGDADLILEGKITEINLGSQFSRVFWGFGAGQSGLTVKGKLIDARTGKELATFEHENSSAMKSGDKWSLMEGEVSDLGNKIAKFIDKLRD